MKRPSISGREELIAPRSVMIDILQKSVVITLIVLSSMPFIIAIIENDIVMLYIALTFLTFSILITLILRYFTMKYRTLLLIEKDQHVMMKVKKGQATVTYNLDIIKELTSQRILEPFWCQYKLILQLSDGQTVELFNVSASKLERNWEQFAERISIIINKPLIKELWVVDLDGRKSLIPFETVTRDQRKALLLIIILLIILIIPFLGALIFHFSPITGIFVSSGCGTVLVNTAICLYFVFKDKDMFEKWVGRKFVLVSIGLSSMGPSILLYIFYVFILNHCCPN